MRRGVEERRPLVRMVVFQQYFESACGSPQVFLSKATAIIVQALGRAQNSSGAWPKCVPFFQTVNALAHLDVRAVDPQLKLSFERLLKTQHRDGTWGRTQKEWNTFLIVHALKNKGLL